MELNVRHKFGALVLVEDVEVYGSSIIAWQKMLCFYWMAMVHLLSHEGNCFAFIGWLSHCAKHVELMFWLMHSNECWRLCLFPCMQIIKGDDLLHMFTSQPLPLHANYEMRWLVRHAHFAARIAGSLDPSAAAGLDPLNPWVIYCNTTSIWYFSWLSQISAFGSFDDPSLCNAWSWMFWTNNCLWTVGRALLIFDCKMLAWRTSRCLEVKKQVELEPKLKPKLVPKCLWSDPRASLARSWNSMRASWNHWAKSWARQVGCGHDSSEFWSSKNRNVEAKPTEKSVQDSIQNVLSFGDCFWSDFRKVFEAKMVVVPSRSHIEVDICWRRATCEKHHKNRCEFKFFMYHMDHNSNELRLKVRNRTIQTRPAWRRSILRGYKAHFGEFFWL